MKRIFPCFCLLAGLLVMAGCHNTTASSQSNNGLEAAQAAYTAFLSGDISQFSASDTETWGLTSWKETILAGGNLEYTYLDLDGDGTDELLVQYVDSPEAFNGVFHYDGTALQCWQFDPMEGSNRDYPLQNGTMVRQYDSNGASTYTLFLYGTDGEPAYAGSFFSREELIPENSDLPCPYYEINGEETDKSTFEEQLNLLVTTQRLSRSDWTAI